MFGYVIQMYGQFGPRFTWVFCIFCCFSRLRPEPELEILFAKKNCDGTFGGQSLWCMGSFSLLNVSGAFVQALDN